MVCFFFHRLLTVFWLKSRWLFFTFTWLDSPVPSYLRGPEVPEQLPHIGFISLNHKSCTCRFSNISITDQDWSKYSFSKVSWNNTPKLQLWTTIEKIQGSAERKRHSENWMSLIKIWKMDTFHPLNGGGIGICQSQLFWSPVISNPFKQRAKLGD